MQGAFVDAWMNTRHVHANFRVVSFSTSFISTLELVKAITLSGLCYDYPHADWLAPGHMTQRRPAGVSLHGS